MTAAVPLLAEALSLAITEHWRDVAELHAHRTWVIRGQEMGLDALAAQHDEDLSAGVEALAVALHARLQEQGTLT